VAVEAWPSLTSHARFGVRRAVPARRCTGRCPMRSPRDCWSALRRLSILVERDGGPQDTRRERKISRRRHFRYLTVPPDELHPAALARDANASQSELSLR
jgi:hypothetical protein